MIYEKAIIKDISVLIDLRIAYLQEDLGEITDRDLDLIKTDMAKPMSRTVELLQGYHI